MARYMGYFVILVPLEKVRQPIFEVLHSCNFDTIYDSGDCIMAKELPGNVAVSKLVTLEILVTTNTGNQGEIKLNMVAKNDELPLQLNNHCREMLNLVSKAMKSNRQWELLDSVII
jgi:hypothetical protein